MPLASSAFIAAGCDPTPPDPLPKALFVLSRTHATVALISHPLPPPFCLPGVCTKCGRRPVCTNSRELRAVLKNIFEEGFLQFCFTTRQLRFVRGVVRASVHCVTSTRHTHKEGGVWRVDLRSLKRLGSAGNPGCCSCWSSLIAADHGSERAWALGLAKPWTRSQYHSLVARPISSKE